MKPVFPPRDDASWLLAFVVLGVAFRVARWLAGMPLWGDEVMYALNFIDRGTNEIFSPLDYGQIAPPLFLAYTWVAVKFAAASEIVLRALPATAGIAGFLLFARISLHALRGREALLAIAVLAVSYYSVRHGAELKPYSLDLLVAMVVLWATLALRERPDRLRGGIYMAVTTSAVLLSYTGLFAVAASFTALAGEAVRGPDKRRLAVLAAAAVPAALVFFALYAYFIAPHGSANDELFSIWDSAFPPGGIGANLFWLLEQSAGRTFAYPVGGNHFGSVLSLALALLGFVILLRRGDRFLALLLVLPFAFHIAAAFAGVYPYGKSQRISQHLAPSIVLLMSVGLTRLVDREPGARRLPRALASVLAVLVAIGVAAIGESLLRPYKSEGAHEARTFVTETLGPDRCEEIRVVNDAEASPVNYRWYLAVSNRASFGANLREPRDFEVERLCLVIFDEKRHPGWSRGLTEGLEQLSQDYRIVEDARHTAYIYGRRTHPHEVRHVVLRAEGDSAG